MPKARKVKKIPTEAEIVTPLPTGDALKEITDKLTEELEKRHTMANQISRKGNQIVIPPFMSLEDATDAIMTWQRQMEEGTEKGIEIKGHPSDLLIAFQQAVTETFGQLIGTKGVVQTFFGAMTTPSQSRSVQIGPNETVSVPYGAVKVPGLPIKMTVKVKQHKERIMESMLMVYAEYTKKYEPLVEMIEEAIHRRLKNHSIFNHKAINSRFDFINLDGFPLDRIIYAQQEEQDLNAHIFRIIRSTAEAEAGGLPVKRTVLLYGKYGTGKTLTALLAAHICMEHNWTFMNVVPGDDIANALEFAKRYEPCLVFFEDIDQATTGERDEISRILNIVDGLLSKNSRVMTILTTNFADRIEKAMLRPGRIDAVIELGRVDKHSLPALIRNYCGDLLQDGKKHTYLEVEALLEAAKDYTPSFIAEACNRAILYALDRVNGKTDEVQITSKDLEGALTGLRSQYELMIKDGRPPRDNIETLIGKIVKKEYDGHLEDMMSEIRKMLADW